MTQEITRSFSMTHIQSFPSPLRIPEGGAPQAKQGTLVDPYWINTGRATFESHFTAARGHLDLEGAWALSFLSFASYYPLMDHTSVCIILSSIPSQEQCEQEPKCSFSTIHIQSFPSRKTNPGPMTEIRQNPQNPDERRGGRAIYYFQGREQAKNQTQTRPT